MVFGGGVVSNAFGCFSRASGCLDTCVGSRYMLMVFNQYPDILVSMRRLGPVSLGSWQCVACCVGDVSMVSWGRVAGSRGGGLEDDDCMVQFANQTCRLNSFAYFPGVFCLRVGLCMPGRKQTP